MFLERLEVLGSECDDASSRTLPSGARFVRNLPDEGPLAYLHSVYPPLGTDALAHCEAALGRPLPNGLRYWLSKANGATLFDKTIYLFGFTERMHRSLSLEDQTAISLTSENEMFALCNRSLWDTGWIKVGSLSGWTTTLELQMHSTGRCALAGDAERRVEFVSFDEMMTVIVQRVSPCFSCVGVTDKSYVALEATLSRFFAAH